MAMTCISGARECCGCMACQGGKGRRKVGGGLASEPCTKRRQQIQTEFDKNRKDFPG